MKKKYSAIWLHFDDEDGQRAKCNHCNASISFAGGCNGNLRRHLKLKHSITHLNEEEKKVFTSEEDTTFEETIDELLTKEHFDELPSTSSQATTVTRELEESNDIKQKRKYSVIWLHFQEIGGQRAKCNYCNASISFFGGCHGNLKRHLKLKHALTQLKWKDVSTSKEETNFEHAIDELTSKEHSDELPTTSTEVTTETQENLLEEYIKFRSRDTTKRKYSAVWLHFEEKGSKRAKCNICKATLSISGGSHGNLRRHLKSKHSLTPFNVKRSKLFTSQEETNFDETIDGLSTKKHFDELPTTNSEVTTETQEGQLEEYITFQSGDTSKKKYSAVWLHFEEKDGEKAKCNLCNVTLSISGGSHGNLRRHLKFKHPLTFVNLERTKLLPIKSEKNLDDSLDEWPAEKSFEEPPTSTQENQIEEYLIGPSPICEVEQIDRQVLKMLVKGHHSFRLVEDPEFKKLISDVSNCSGYMLPSKDVLSHSLFPRMYMELLEEIKGKLQFATAACLTTDGWTSKTNVSYLAVTAHYINADTKHTSHLLACGEFKNQQTSDDFFNFLKKVANDFKINDKITAIVNNNSPNIADAIRQGGWQEIGCFANSLNLIIQSAINEIADTTDKVRKIIDHFHKSDDAFKQLLTAEKTAKLPELKLKPDVSPKWNSVFEILLTINRIRDLVTSILPSSCPELMLTVEDWEIIEEAIPILRPFQETANEILREKNVTLAKVLVMFNLLERCIFECVPFNEKVTAMVTNLQSGLASRLENLEKVSLYAESIILDPRFKRKGFKSDASYEEAVWNLRNKICNVSLPDSEEVTSTTLNLKAERESIWDAFDLELNLSLRSESNASVCMREFDKYIDEEYLDRKCDPLLWWKERKHIYPRLYSYALKCLCVVACSIPCERILTTGQMISDRRAFSKTNKFGKLLFLYYNM